MKKIGIDIADTIIDVWPLLMHNAEKFNAEHSNNVRNNNKHLYLPEDIFGWNELLKKEFWKNYGEKITFFLQ